MKKILFLILRRRSNLALQGEVQKRRSVSILKRNEIQDKLRPLGRRVEGLILVLSCLYISGCCSIPRTANYQQLYGLTREEKQIKNKLGGKRKLVLIRDFRENEMFDEDMIALNEKVEKYISSHADLNESTKNNLRAFKVTEGTTKEEVRLLLGVPDKVAKIGKKAYLASELWIYKINKISIFTIVFLPVFFGHQEYHLYFKDNTLTLIERHYLEQTFSSSDPSIGIRAR